MSRVCKLPIKVPFDISVDIKDKILSFKKGNLERSYCIKHNVEVSFADNLLKFKSSKDTDIKFVGLDRSNVNNIVSGLINKFNTKLEVNGVGYKFSIKDFFIIFNLGYSHEIIYCLPENVEAKFEKPNILSLSSIDKVLLGKVCADIISFRPPEPYKGKGIKKLGQDIIRKEGKKK